MEDQSNRKRARDDSGESEFDLLEVKRLRDDLLGILDESDLDPATQDLDSVMKSFEDEISASSSPVPIIDLTSDSGESQPELGYLLEASDDELGLPPSTNASCEVERKEETELARVSSDSSEIGECLWGFEDQIRSYDSFEFGVGGEFAGNNEYVALDGLFEYSDVYYVSSDFSDFSWRPENIPAE